jgi:hypothetical protein
VALGLVGCYLLAAWPDLQALATSAYPGRRRLNGGDYTLAQLFGAVYNFQTTRIAPIGSAVFNASESSGFILFLPAVLFAVLLFTRARRRLDPAGWALLGLGMVQVLYCRFHFPHWLADVTLWSHTQGFRSQLAIGLVSIVLSLYLLKPDPEPKPLTRREWLAASAVVLATAGFYFWIGVSLQHIRNVFPKTVLLGGGWFPVTMQLVTALHRTAGPAAAAGQAPHLRRRSGHRAGRDGWQLQPPVNRVSSRRSLATLQSRTAGGARGSCQRVAQSVAREWWPPRTTDWHTC